MRMKDIKNLTLDRKKYAFNQSLYENINLLIFSVCIFFCVNGRFLLLFLLIIFFIIFREFFMVLKETTRFPCSNQFFSANKRLIILV